MKKPFIYSGPLSSVTLRDKEGKQEEVVLHDGRLVNLDPDHPHIQRMINRNLLTSAAPVVERPRLSSSRSRSRAGDAEASTNSSTTEPPLTSGGLPGGDNS